MELRCFTSLSMTYVLRQFTEIGMVRQLATARQRGRNAKPTPGGYRDVGSH
jgi:hypothetical protein